MAFLDDIYGKSDPDRSAAVFTTIQEELLRVGIRVHDGKTQLWSRSGVVPTGAQALTEAAQRLDPEAIVWRGDVSLPPQEQGVMVLGTPMGQPEFVKSKIGSSFGETRPSGVTNCGNVRSPMCMVLLLHCASARPNYMLRVVHPALSAGFAGHHDATMRQALSQLVAAPPCNMYWASHFLEVDWAFEVQF